MQVTAKTSTSTSHAQDRNWRVVKPRDRVRLRALERLYERRSAVNNLIGALERYQRDQKRLKGRSAKLTVAAMSS